MNNGAERKGHGKAKAGSSVFHGRKPLTKLQIIWILFGKDWPRFAATAYQACRVLAEGRLQIRSYETKGSEQRRMAEVLAVEVEFLTGRKKAARTN